MRGVALLMAVLGISGCDVGHPREDPRTGPALRIVATYPEDGAGLACTADDPDDCGIPRNAPVEVRFDRFLRPETASRQSLRVLVRVPDLAVFLQPRYDVIERVVSYHPFGGLWEAGALHTVELPIPTDEFPDGFRAFDGAPLEGADVPSIRFTFRTARENPAPLEEDPPPSCAQALAIFTEARCSSAACHSGSAPVAGLRLDTGQGIADTAIGRVAHETETGVEVDRPLADPPVFGRQMPIIEPGAPWHSYLVYKLLANRENYGSMDAECPTAHTVPVDERCITPSPEETARLHDGFVRLEAMPPGGRSLDSVETLRKIVAYIEAGAPLDDCP